MVSIEPNCPILDRLEYLPVQFRLVGPDMQSDFPRDPSKHTRPPREGDRDDTRRTRTLAS